MSPAGTDFCLQGMRQRTAGRPAVCCPGVWGLSAPGWRRGHVLDGAFAALAAGDVLLDEQPPPPQQALRNAGKPPDLYYLRNQARMEIDLLLAARRRFRAVEIKTAMTRQPDQARHLETFRKLAGDRLEKSAVAYAGDLEVSTGGTDWISFRHTARWLST